MDGPLERTSSHLDRAGQLLARAFQQLPAGQEEVRRALDLAAGSLHRAREGAAEPASLITVAHSRVLRAALAVVGATPGHDAASPARMSGPAAREPHSNATVELLFEACASLLAAEEQLTAVDPPPAAEPELPLAAYPIDRCAKIAASMHYKPEIAAAILEAHELDRPLWARLQAHWDDAIDREIKRGKADLVQTYDGAYVAQLEQERGEIDVEDYVSLKVAAARGTRADTLTELRIPPQAVMSIERLWLAKIIDNGNLRRRVRLALDQRRSS